MTRMLASVTGPAEAEIALAGGADIVDLKDPGGGALGAVDPAVIRATVKAVAGRRPVSAVAGDLAPEPETLRTGAEAIAATGVDFVKLGLFPGPRRPDCVRALAPLANRARLIGVVFADRDPDFSLVDPMAEAGFAGAMLDTAGKNGTRLLDCLPPAELHRFTLRCRDKGLLAGLAGGLEAPDVPRLLPLGPDVLGFRGALCRNQDRRLPIEPEAVAAIRRLIPREIVEDDAVKPDYILLAGRHYNYDDRGDATAFDRIYVRDLVLPVSIGAYRRERDEPQRVRFNVVAEVRRRTRGADDMGEVFSYDVIADAIRALVASGHFTLVETLAERIAGAVIEHRQVRGVTVRVEKLDVGQGVVGIEIERRRAAEAANVLELFPTSVIGGGPKAAS